MQLRYDVGETARFELIRAQTEFLNAQIASESGKLRVEQARNGLRQVVGHALPDNFSVVHEQPKVENLPLLNILLGELQAQSPELQKAKADVEASESKLSFEKNSRLPKLAFKVSQYNDPNFTDRLYGLQISIPIWDFKGGQVVKQGDVLAKITSTELTQSQLACLKAKVLASWPTKLLIAQSKLPPLNVVDMGSFHVGGCLVEISGRPIKEVVFSPGSAPAKIDPNGNYLVEQMYVQYFIPRDVKGKLPIMLWHAGGLTGVTYETTPDGREGWQNYFIRKGWKTYVSDAVERGRLG